MLRLVGHHLQLKVTDTSRHIQFTRSFKSINALHIDVLYLEFRLVSEECTVFFFLSHCVSYHHVFYSTVTKLVIKPTSPLYWGTIRSCLRSDFFFRPLMGHYEGLSITRIYQDTVLHIVKANMHQYV